MILVGMAAQNARKVETALLTKVTCAFQAPYDPTEQHGAEVRQGVDECLLGIPSEKKLTTVHRQAVIACARLDLVPVAVQQDQESAPLPQ